MELEFHQLDLRYERLRTSSRNRDRRILASLDEHGQQLPVVVVAGADDGRYVLVDGYKRVRALRKLGHDTVRATCWDLGEDEALLLGRLMQTADGDSALEQAWLLLELRERFGLTVEELARRFDRSMGWVSGRLGLVTTLPEPIQEEVRRGRLVPHAAMKYLLPLSRSNKRGAIELATAIAPLRPSTRQTEALCVAYARGDPQSRSHLLRHPDLFLHAREEGDVSLPAGPAELLSRDIGALGGIARRAAKRVAAGALRELIPPEQDEMQRRADTARDDVERLVARIEQEVRDAGRGNPNDDPQAA
jgi:ParB/RepB/Spo0J family partition protein